MADLSSIVEVNITLNSGVTVIKSVNYSLPLILGTHTVFTEAYRAYTSLAAMKSDGFREDQAEYKAAKLMLEAQQTSTDKEYVPPIPKVYIGRRSADAVVISVNTLQAQYNYTIRDGAGKYSWYKQGTTAPTVSEVVNGLKTVINAASATATIHAETDGTYLTITPKVLGSSFICIADNEKESKNYLSYYSYTVTRFVKTDLDDILMEANDWFAIMETSRNKNEILEIGYWANNNKKFFMCVSNESAILDSPLLDFSRSDALQESVENHELVSDSGSIAAMFYAANTQYVAVIYHSSLTDLIDASWLGNQLRLKPGSSNFANRNLDPSIKADVLTEDQKENVLAKLCNIYEEYGGLSLTVGGTVSNTSYRYIDVVRDIDQNKTNIQTGLIYVIATTPKIPYTTEGEAIISASLRSILAADVAAGIYTDNPAPEVLMPSISEISNEDKLNRVLNNVVFTATLRNAVNKVVVNGNVNFSS